MKIDYAPEWASERLQQAYRDLHKAYTLMRYEPVKGAPRIIPAKPMATRRSSK